MTPSEFLSLNDFQRAEAVRSGVAIADREDENHNIVLFQIHGFYMEVFCDRKCHHISRLEVFSNIERLAPYLEQIEIDELFL